MNWGADVVKFEAQNVLFSMLVASNLGLGDHRAMLGTWEHTEGDLGVPGLDDGKHSPE